MRHVWKESDRKRSQTLDKELRRKWEAYSLKLKLGDQIFYSRLEDILEDH